jgi:hypothetical protein
MRLLRKAAAVGLLVSTLLPFANAQASSKVLSETKSIQDCVSEKRNLDVLMLVDESSSLKGDSAKKIVGNDPDDLRVDALRSIAQLLASTVDASNSESEESSGIDVKLSIAGFGEKYTTRASVSELNGKTLPNFVQAIEDQRDFDNDRSTRYHVGLGGALEDFLKHKQDDENSCRLLVWFSDGVHNDDGRTGISSAEVKQITNQLCGEGEIVDQLRTEGVYIVAAGLNPNEEELGLMRLIAAGGNSFAGIGLDKCGSVSPTGVFEQATNAEEIINKIFDVLAGVPGIPTSPVSLPNCSDGTENCNEIAFTADGTMSSFTILATRPNTNIVTELKMSNGQTVNLFPSPGKAPDQKNVASFFHVSDTKVLVAVSRGTGASIDGSWALRFKGVGSAEAIGAVNFVGNAKISIDEVSDTKKALKVNRFGASPISVNVKSKSSDASIRGVEVSLANFEGVEDLGTTRDDLGVFTVSANSLESALKSPVLGDSSSATLRITPVGDVPGLTTLDGRPVKVEFNSETYEVLISNGASYPTFKGIKESDIRFKGTPTKTVTLLFDGPDGADGSVEFGQFKDLDEAADFEIVDPKTCVIPVKTSDFECEVKIVLNKVAYGDFNLPLPVTYVSADGSQDAEVVIPVKALKPTNAGKGILAAIELIAIFLVIQGLVRLLLSYLMSRFAPLAATARRVRLDAVVDSNGGVTINPLNVNPSQVDESFTFENIEPTTSFNIFGYQFDCSVMRTFMKSTTSPVGIVSRDSTVVVGSRGHQFTKSDPQSTQGLVGLSLRGQWLIGIRSADVQSLVNGEMSAPAEVVAFLDPYGDGGGMSPRNQQLADLSFTVASSNFASEFSDVISRFRDLNQADQTDPSGGNVSDGWDSTSTNASGTSVSGFDAFGDSIGGTQNQSTPEGKGKPKEKRRKKEKNVDFEQDSSSGSSSQSANNDWDPFA